MRYQKTLVPFVTLALALAANAVPPYYGRLFKSRAPPPNVPLPPNPPKAGIPPSPGPPPNQALPPTPNHPPWPGPPPNKALPPTPNHPPWPGPPPNKALPPTPIKKKASPPIPSRNPNRPAAPTSHQRVSSDDLTKSTTPNYSRPLPKHADNSQVSPHHKGEEEEEEEKKKKKKPLEVKKPLEEKESSNGKKVAVTAAAILLAGGVGFGAGYGIKEDEDNTVWFFNTSPQAAHSIPQNNGPGSDQPSTETSPDQSTSEPVAKRDVVQSTYHPRREACGLD
ncbi:hypothetical protein GGU11DRAFT_830476 [Lentinula aff. detonsa]|nr:hypothetical protein GGU11DRAFT_830476 [Lentinula aff. detonsa]